MEPVYTSVIWIARALFAAEGLKFTVTGAENIPTAGGAVLVSNHLSYFDFAYAGLVALPSKRLVRFMAKDSVFRHKISGPLMRGMDEVGRGAFAGPLVAAAVVLPRGFRHPWLRDSKKLTAHQREVVAEGSAWLAGLRIPKCGCRLGISQSSSVSGPCAGTL